MLIREGHFRRKVWEAQQTRVISYTYAAGNRDPNKPFPTIQQFLPLPFDDEEQGNEDAETKRLQDILNRYKEGKYGRRTENTGGG